MRTTMKHPHGSKLLALAVLVLAGSAVSCGGTDHAAAPKPASDAPLLPANAEPVPTNEQADAAAAAAIQADNADAELEKLKDELGDG